MRLFLKIFSVIAVFILFNNNVYSQTTGDDEGREYIVHKEMVPEAVLNAFNKNYPGIKKLYYRRLKLDGKKLFKIASNILQVYYYPDGKVFRVIEKLEKDEIPNNIFYKLLKKYPLMEIMEVSKISEEDKQDVYDITLKEKDEIYKIKMNRKGIVLKDTDIDKTKIIPELKKTK